MKYFSEILNKTFDSEKECIVAEADYAKEQKIAKETEEKKAAEVSKRKKELSRAVEEADKKVEEANKLYEIAQDKAAKILEESNKQVKDILDTAEKEVKAAEEEKFNAILSFNKEFGPYSISFTGAKAAEDFKKSVKRFDKTLRNIVEDLFIF